MNESTLLCSSLSSTFSAAVDPAPLRGHRVPSAFTSALVARLSADCAARSSASTSNPGRVPNWNRRVLSDGSCHCWEACL